MKRSIFLTLRLLSIAIFALLGVALMTGAVSLDEIMSFGAAGGSTLAMAAGAAYSQEGTVKSVKDGVTGGSYRVHYDNTVSNEVVKMKPSATPIDTILRKTNRIVPVRSWESEWYAVDVRATMDTTAAATVETNGNTTWTAKTMTVTNPHMWTIDDLIKVNAATFKSSTHTEQVPASTPISVILHVIEKNGAALKVIPIYHPDQTWDEYLSGTTKYDTPSIASGAKLTRIGNAKAEKAAQTTAYAVFPEKFSNFCQIHMAQVEESVHSRLHKKEVPWDIYDYQTQSLYDMRRAAEFTSIWGLSGKVFDPTASEWKFTSGGLNQYVTKELTYYLDTKFGNPLFAAWAQNVFEGNSGSDKRFMFAGSDLIKRLASVDTVAKQIEAKSTEVVFGLTFSKIETPFGILLIKMHNLYNDMYEAGNGIILDMNNIEKHVFKPMESRELEFIKSGQKMATGFVVDETFCLALKYPDTHRKIRYIGSNEPS